MHNDRELPAPVASGPQLLDQVRDGKREGPGHDIAGGADRTAEAVACAREGVAREGSRRRLRQSSRLIEPGPLFPFFPVAFFLTAHGWPH